GNKGGQFRTADVDIETTTDAGGGYDVGWTRPGEWLQYTVNVAADSQYDLTLRIASTGSGGSLHLEVDGADVTGPIQVPNTGGWQTWTAAPGGTVPLSAGSHRLRLVFDVNGSTGGVANVNRLELSRSGGATPFVGVVVSLPGTIEAENFDDGGQSIAYFDTSPGNRGGQYRPTDVDIETSSDAGGGFDVGWTRPGEWLQYTANVTATGIYALELRVASFSTGGTVRVEGDVVDVTGTLMMPNTGGWQTWSTVRTAGIQLQAGVHRFRLVFLDAGTNGICNVNYLRVTP